MRSCFWPYSSTVEQLVGAGTEVQMPNAEMSAWFGISCGSSTNAPCARIVAIASSMICCCAVEKPFQNGTRGTAMRAPLSEFFLRNFV